MTQREFIDAIAQSITQAAERMTQEAPEVGPLDWKNVAEGKEWPSMADLVDRVVMPAVRDAFPPNGVPDQLVVKLEDLRGAAGVVDMRIREIGATMVGQFRSMGMDSIGNPLPREDRQPLWERRGFKDEAEAAEHDRLMQEAERDRPASRQSAFGIDLKD